MRIPYLNPDELEKLREEEREEEMIDEYIASLPPPAPAPTTQNEVVNRYIDKHKESDEEWAEYKRKVEWEIVNLPHDFWNKLIIKEISFWTHSGPIFKYENTEF